MSNMEKYTAQRAGIVAALKGCGKLTTVLFNKDEIPKILPAAIVILDEETGTKGTHRSFRDTDIAWTIYLIVNAHNVSDPDAELYALKEDFRAQLQTVLGRDIPQVEYYTSRVDGSRLVRVAKIDLLKAGTGAAS